MSDAFRGLRLYNTLTRAKEDFVPIDPTNVRMYVCGPTVYDYAHIGNARPAIVFDVLYRLLQHLAKQGVWDGGKGETQVTYVRNITDVDDKINARALRDYGAEIEAGRLTLNEAIRKVTEPTYDQYQKDVAALGCLPPTFQPRATEFVQPRADGRSDMITLIQRLIENGHAYVANGEVLFDTASMQDYGQLSKRPLDEQQAGARIAVDAHKKSPGDFVLWKLSSAEEPGWESPWGRGRPGWHIECSAMAEAYLGQVFDIHGGGLDLIFPHHENEIAQSRCAHGTEMMANYWMHNGFLQVEGRKMSKSEGNFFTIDELLNTTNFGGRKWPGEVLRLAMLMTHYREPIDFSVQRLREARQTLIKFKRDFLDEPERWANAGRAQFDVFAVDKNVLDALNDDLNIYAALSALHRLQKEIFYQPLDSDRLRVEFSNSLVFLGFDKLDDLYDQSGFIASPEESYIAMRIEERLDAIAVKNWAEADRIRDELLAQGIQLKDGKDPATGERITTWEVKR